MPQGIQVWNASGQLILDLTDRLLRIASTGAADATPSTAVTISDQTNSPPANGSPPPTTGTSGRF